MSSLPPNDVSKDEQKDMERQEDLQRVIEKWIDRFISVITPPMLPIILNLSGPGGGIDYSAPPVVSRGNLVQVSDTFFILF